MSEAPANRPTAIHRLFRLLGALALVAVVGAFAAAGSFARPHRHHLRRHHALVRRTRGITAHGQLIHRFGSQLVQPLAAATTNQSTNWSGYNQGTLEQNGKLFHSISAYWTVPKVTQHTKGQAEYSADWIGIGGGCVDAGCVVTDATLIQTGTEQDVNSNGTTAYSAWWEIIPAPSLTITSLKIHPGDRMHAYIAESVPYSNVWKIFVKDITRGQTYSTTIPYTSTHATAEWIEETPLIIGAGGGFAACPTRALRPSTMQPSTAAVRT